MSIKFNNGNFNFFIVYDGAILKNVSLVSDVNYKSSYDLIRMDNRDGFILDNRNSMEQINRQFTFYTKGEQIERIGKILKFNKMAKIYFNNSNYFCRGFCENISYKKFAGDFYEVVVSLVLQPYIMGPKVVKTFTENGSIVNEGDFRAYPFIRIFPKQSDFSLSINSKTMRFSVKDSLKENYIVDFDKVEIKDCDGNLKNSIFHKDSDFLYLDTKKKGVNSIVLNNIEKIVLAVNWRYMFYDIYKRR